MRRLLLESLLAGAIAAGIAGPAVLAQDAPITPSQDKDVTTLDGIDISAGLVPVPNVGDGAPQFTSEELARIGRAARKDNTHYQREAQVLQECFLENYGGHVPEERVQGYLDAHEAAMRLSAFAQAAEYATEDAIAMRREAAVGRATMAQVEEAELKRQLAVKRVIVAQNALAEGVAMALDAQELSTRKIPVEDWRSMIQERAFERASREAEAWNPVPEQYRDLRLENVQAVSREDPKLGTYVRVTGLIRNPRSRRIAIPPLSVSAVDETGYALHTEVATARGRIEPGGATPFAFELKPMPPRARTVAVTFGDPNRPTWLLPASADRACIPPPPDEFDPARLGRLGSRRLNARAFQGQSDPKGFGR